MRNANITILLLTATLLGDIIWVVTDPRPHFEKIKIKITMTYPRVTATLIPQIISGLFFPYYGGWNSMFTVCGIILFALGLSMALWARFSMGVRWAPPDAHNIQRQEKLITKGPFAFTRNPIYLGVTLLVLGFSLAVKSYFIFLVVPLFYSLRKSAIKEEYVLEKHFGTEYLKYKEKIPRFLV